METDYDVPDGAVVTRPDLAPPAEADVHIRYRRPYGSSAFWVRLGETFVVPEVPAEFIGEEDQGDGWWGAEATIAFPLDSDYVFARTKARPNRPEWQVLSPLGRSISKREGREALLPTWYVLAGLTLDNELQQAADVFGQGRRNPTAERLELAIVNVCAACGLSTYFAGKILSTQGVDFLALDEDESRIYAFSVTAANGAMEKYRS